MKKATRRRWQAENRHKRKRWSAERQVACSPQYQVTEEPDGWYVTVGGVRAAGPFNNAAAWRWIDSHSIARRYGA
jgi:hypothetical protein